MGNVNAKQEQSNLSQKNKNPTLDSTEKQIGYEVIQLNYGSLLKISILLSFLNR